MTNPPILYCRYWKLSLLVHPDKCPHPSAQEAFVKLNNAFKDLQDPDKVHEFFHTLKLGSSFYQSSTCIILPSTEPLLHFSYLDKTIHFILWSLKKILLWNRDTFYEGSCLVCLFSLTDKIQSSTPLSLYTTYIFVSGILFIAERCNRREDKKERGDGAIRGELL